MSQHQKHGPSYHRMRLHERRHAAGTRAAAIAAAVVALSLGFAWLQEHDKSEALVHTATNPATVPADEPRSVWQRGHTEPTASSDCADCPKMLSIPGGRFVMGLRQDTYQTLAIPARQAARELPLHWANVAPFSLGQAEVTRGEFAAYAKAVGAPSTGCEVIDPSTGAAMFDPKASWQNPGFEQTDEDPVVCVSWQDAHDYAAWLAKRTGHAYRLPTETEWEWAARAGSNTAWFWRGGASQACRYANGEAAIPTPTDARTTGDRFPCDDGFTFTAPTDAVAPNSAGLYHMLGNAAEWMADCMTEGYWPDPSAARECPQHVVRGGSWHDGPSMVRSSARISAAETFRSNRIGFRVARDAP